MILTRLHERGIRWLAPWGALKAAKGRGWLQAPLDPGMELIPSGSGFSLSSFLTAPPFPRCWLPPRGGRNGSSLIFSGSRPVGKSQPAPEFPARVSMHLSALPGAHPSLWPEEWDAQGKPGSDGMPALKPPGRSALLKPQIQEDRLVVVQREIRYGSHLHSMAVCPQVDLEELTSRISRNRMGYEWVPR